MFDSDTFRSTGHAVIDLLADYLDKNLQGKGDVLDWQAPQEAIQRWQQPMPQEPTLTPAGFLTTLQDEVLAGTGLVEAGTYIAILFGTILAGWIPVEVAAGGIVVTALIGYATAQFVPPAPPQGHIDPIDWNPFTSSARLIRATMGNAQVYYAILAISFFWTIGAVLFILFPPLVKNVLTADERVACVDVDACVAVSDAGSLVHVL